jgi:uncharacterized protein YmfQ (DUF2313 family)
MATSLEQLVPKQRFFAFQYLNALLQLLPCGPLWGAKLFRLASDILQDTVTTTGDTQDNTNSNIYEVWSDQPSDGNYSNSLFGVILSAFATELALIDAAAIDIFRQQIPGVSTYMLEDWERVLALPETSTVAITQTVEERQTIAQAKFFTAYNVGLNAQFYIDYAAKLGFVITVEESADLTSPFYVAPTGIDLYDIGSRMNARLNDAYQVGNVVFTIVSGPTDSTYLKYVMEKLKPAHVVIYWIG